METTSVIKYISNWLLKYSNSSNSNGFVVGVSGGIDSALTSTLAAKTGLPLICIEMPIYQNKKQVKRGITHIEWLKHSFPNVKSIKLDLTKVLEEFTKNIPENNNQLALANTRARLRMTTLYYFAQINNCLVLGTGNKVEDFGIGFFTKYGDGGVDISPIADLLKSEVYALSESLNINPSILNAPPTDGLWESNKTDEDQIGASYPELEWAMQYRENDKELSKREKKVLKIYTQLNNKNQHKMRKIPICKIPKHLK